MILLINTCGKSNGYCIKNLVTTFEKLQTPFRIVNKLDDLGLTPPCGIVISGSPIRFTQRMGPESTMRLVLAVQAHLRWPKVPVLGICFGFQLLNLMYGGAIEPFGRLVCERHHGLEYCFNDYIVKVGDGFVVKKRVVIDGRSIVCAVACKKRDLCITGYLFHSETTDLDAHGWIRRWVSRCLMLDACLFDKKEPKQNG